MGLGPRQVSESTLSGGKLEAGGSGEQKQGTLGTWQQRDSLVPTCLSSKGTSAVCMEAELFMRLLH